MTGREKAAFARAAMNRAEKVAKTQRGTTVGRLAELEAEWWRELFRLRRWVMKPRAKKTSKKAA